MKINSFKSGQYKQNFQYKSFSPSCVNHEWTWDDPLVNVLLENATRALASLDAYSMIVPDVDLFIRMHMLKEANTSSRIEGTKTSIDEDLTPIEEIAPEKRDDWQEVQNYLAAMNLALEEIQSIPLSNRLLRNIHAALMKGVRGNKKYPGEFRRSQNWIGGSNLTDASYIPPTAEELPDLMSDLENFLHNETIAVPHLIRIAIAHYQFETVHPFCDGNGRIGRLLIPLYFISKGLLKKPSLYLSDYFERNRSSYYDALDYPRKKNDLTQWIKFFLNGIIETSQNGIITFNKILELKTTLEKTALSLNRRADSALKLINLLYRKPVVHYQNVCEELSLTPRPANELLKTFIDEKILVEITGKQRNKKYAFDPYLKIFVRHNEANNEQKL